MQLNQFSINPVAPFPMESSINYIQLIFLTIAILTFLPGLITNYGEKFFPSVLNQFIRYGRANVAKDGNRPGILKLIEVPKKLVMLMHKQSLV